MSNIKRKKYIVRDRQYRYTAHKIGKETLDESIFINDNTTIDISLVPFENQIYFSGSQNLGLTPKSLCELIGLTSGVFIYDYGINENGLFYVPSDGEYEIKWFSVYDGNQTYLIADRCIKNNLSYNDLISAGIKEDAIFVYNNNTYQVLLMTGDDSTPSIISQWDNLFKNNLLYNKDSNWQGVMTICGNVLGDTVISRGGISVGYKELVSKNKVSERFGFRPVLIEVDEITYNILFNTEPINANLTINGNINISNGSSIRLPEGGYTYNISAPGYGQKSGTFEVRNYDHTITLAVQALPLIPSNTGPGPSTLIGGNSRNGFFGICYPEDFINPAVLNTHFNMNMGNLINGTDNAWLKFIIDGEIIYKSMKAIRANVSYKYLYDKGLVYGDGLMAGENGADHHHVPTNSTPTTQNGEYTHNGNTYSVRLMKGGTKNPIEYLSPDRSTIGSEWNRLMHPIHQNVLQDTWLHPEFVYEYVQIWTHNLGTGSSGMFTNADLGIGGIFPGRSHWCQESVDEEPEKRIRRGYQGADSSTTFETNQGSIDCGWSPVLVLKQ